MPKSLDCCFAHQHTHLLHCRFVSDHCYLGVYKCSPYLHAHLYPLLASFIASSKSSSVSRDTSMVLFYTCSHGDRWKFLPLDMGGFMSDDCHLFCALWK